MKNSLIKKPLSILLSLLMVLSVFGGMAFTASAATTVTWSGSGLPTGDYTDENGIRVSGGTLYAHGYHDWSGDIKFTAPSGMVFTDISINHMDTDNGGTTTWHWYGNASEVDLYESMYEVSSVTFTLEQAKDPAVKNVESLIDAIGTVALTDDCKAKIDAAEAAYDALSDAQKASVTNAQTLADAVAQYARLEGYAERLVEITNHGAVLGDLGITPQMQNWGIQTSFADAVALAQYLSAQNGGAACAVLYEVVDEYMVYYATNTGARGDRTGFYGYTLNDFASGYKVYYVSVRHPAVMNVEALISAIGTVDASDECKEKIDDARTAYDALKAELQTSVGNYTTLTAAEEAYAAAKALADAKDDAKAELATYKNAADYRTAEQAQLAAAIETGNTNIEAATDIDAVNTALANAKLALDAIKTAAAYEAEEAAAAAAALADAKAQLTTAVDTAKAFYDILKGNEKYATIADTLDTAIQQGEAMLNSTDVADILAKAEQVLAVLASVQEQKGVIDAQPDEPTPDDPTPDDPTPDEPVDEPTNDQKGSFDFISKLFAWLTELFDMFTRWIQK